MPTLTAEAKSRIRMAQAIFTMIVVGAYVAFLVVLTNRQQAALLLETRVAAATAREVIERQRGEVFAAISSVEADILRRLPQPLLDYHFAIYLGDHRRAMMPVGFSVADTLPAEIWQEITEKEDLWSGMLPIAGEKFAVSLAPLKDAEQWSVIGAMLVAQRAEHVGWRSTAGSFAGWVGLVAAVAILVFGYVASRQG